MRDAITRALALVPDVVLMDLSLPELDGWEATRILKADPRTATCRSSRSPGTRSPNTARGQGRRQRRLLTQTVPSEALVEEGGAAVGPHQRAAAGSGRP